MTRALAILVTVAFAASAGIFAAFQSGIFRQAPTVFAPPYPASNVEGHPIIGVFEGRTPCADCERVKMALVLYGRPDSQLPSTYWLARVHVGRSNERIVTHGAVATRHGTREYPDAVVYELDPSTPEELRRYWQISDRIVLLLDQDMNPRVGNASWGYMLSKTR